MNRVLFLMLVLTPLLFYRCKNSEGEEYPKEVKDSRIESIYDSAKVYLYLRNVNNYLIDTSNGNGNRIPIISLGVQNNNKFKEQFRIENECISFFLTFYYNDVKVLPTEHFFSVNYPLLGFKLQLKDDKYGSERNFNFDQEKLGCLKFYMLNNPKIVNRWLYKKMEWILSDSSIKENCLYRNF